MHSLSSSGEVSCKWHHHDSLLQAVSTLFLQAEQDWSCHSLESLSSTSSEQHGLDQNGNQATPMTSLHDEASMLLAVSTMFCKAEKEYHRQHEQEKESHRRQHKQATKNPVNFSSDSLSEEDDDDVSVMSQPQSLLTARIVPEQRTEYERDKPHSRRANLSTVTELRSQVDSRLASLAARQCQDKVTLQEGSGDSDKVSILQVCVTLPSHCEPGVLHCIELCLHRRADETAQRTLQRMKISLERKYGEQERIILRQHHQEQVRMHLSQRKLKQVGLLGTDGQAPTQGSSLPKKGKDNGDRDSVTTLWIKERSHVGLRNDLPANGDYRRFEIGEDDLATDLWESLASYDSAELRIMLDITKTHKDKVRTMPGNDDDLAENEIVDCDGRHYLMSTLPIVACPPTIMSVQTFEDFTAHNYVGVPLVVSVEALHSTHTVLAWFANETLVCWDSKTYTPCSGDVGKLLRVLIVPLRRGHAGEDCEEVYKFANPVEPLPPMPLVSPLRDAWIVRDDASISHPLLPPVHGLRVMTYNLLADLYVSREEEHQIMYGHCPISFLDRKRRMPMILAELLAYRPDVITLQECDQTIFEELFQPCMAAYGYQGFYSNKASAQLEGCAAFWSLDRFEEADESKDLHCYSLRDLFCPESTYERADSLEDIDRLLEAHPELRRVTREKIGQVLQVASLKLRASGDEDMPTRVIVGNTHLFFHPLASHIRLMQAYVVARQLDIVRRASGDCGTGQNPYPIVLCGDFNANPLSGAVQLLLQRHVGPGHHETWKHLQDYEWDMGDQDFLLEHGYIGNEVDCDEPLYEDEAFEDALQELPNQKSDQKEMDDEEAQESSRHPPDIALPPRFPNLISGYKKFPEFTNFAVDFSETLDYILASEASETEPFGLTPMREAPMMSSSEMKKYVAMPNEFMPSDHISLVCDLEWVRYQE